MAVLSPDGVVGRVIVPSARAAKVQLLIDRNAAAGALLERTRAQGVVVGTGEEGLKLDYVLGTAEVTVRGQDPTGHPVETHGVGESLIEAVRNYDRVYESRAPWFDAYETLHTDRYIRDGETLFLPLSANGRDVDMILVFSVQEDLVKSQPGD